MSIELGSISLYRNQELQQTTLLRMLADAHYELKEAVHFSGEVMRRGDCLEVFAVNYPAAVTVEFFGQRIEQLSTIDSGGRKRSLDHLEIAPNAIDADGLRFEPGQYVVHLDHGIGQFRGLGMREVGSLQTAGFVTPYTSGSAARADKQQWSHFLILDYADGAELFVPPDQAGKLTHYIGSRHPVLSRLGSRRWAATRQKVAEDLLKLTRDLLLVAAKRQLHTRSPYVVHAEWLRTADAGFQFDPTDDQQKAILAVLSDLTESTKPMDRLICGDVGFGKTEVALRAAAAVLSAGKQVALLAPTTLLVSQHRATFEQRLGALPVRIGTLSRFTAKQDETVIVEGLKAGTVDLAIGTHRLLQGDIQFRDLGMIIIDEEQKFGVKHKEHLKKLRASVDILTLSATPIPRTLFTGLSGLRDISLIMTPPKNRLPIITFIQKSDDAVLKKAIDLEMTRHGQVFVLHNDVASIQARAQVLRNLVPAARIAVAHGQMDERRLSKTMAAMIDGEYDVLVCSTIIESGLDIPNVNTLIVEKSDHFGLSDLYQIRGRVGRNSRQAYAYFFYDAPFLSRLAEERFRALKESEALGSGYSVALRDLEIRGGGNVLGKEQHGNMEAVGLSLYTKMLQLTVDKLKKQ